MAGEDWPLVPLGELTENLDGRRVPVKENDRNRGHIHITERRESWTVLMATFSTVSICSSARMAKTYALARHRLPSWRQGSFG
jgi:hypothetical protein